MLPLHNIISIHWLNAYGGIAKFMEAIRGGNYELIAEYPDGSLEISSRDLKCLYVMGFDPGVEMVRPCGDTQYKTLAPFGGIPNILRMPYDIDRKVLKESFAVWPNAMGGGDPVEYRLNEIPFIIRFEKRFPAAITAELLDSLRKMAAGVRPIYGDSVEWPDRKLVTSVMITKKELVARLDITGLDQKILNWGVLCMLNTFVALGRPHGLFKIALTAEDEELAGFTGELVEL